jgi:hypothetical protein
MGSTLPTCEEGVTEAVSEGGTPLRSRISSSWKFRERIYGCMGGLSFTVSKAGIWYRLVGPLVREWSSVCCCKWAVKGVKSSLGTFED